MWTAIIIILVALFVIWLLRPNSVTEEMKESKEKLRLKYNVPDTMWYGYFCISGADVLEESQQYGTWKDDNKIKFIREYYDSYLEIPIEDIIFFQAKGEDKYITEVSGGGGGGSSVGGAIVGGMIAGPAGAIVGSRKKNKEITSSTTYVDNRKTILSFTKDGDEKVLVFDKGMLYDKLLTICPNKDYEIVKLKSTSENHS